MPITLPETLPAFEVLSREGVMWSVSDLNSTNGLRVNGQRIHNHVIADGDVIQIGNIEIICHVIAADDADTTQSPALEIEGEQEFAATQVLADGDDDAPDSGSDDPPAWSRASG